MTRLAIGAEHLYSKGRVDTDQETDIRHTVVPFEAAQELYLESEGGTRFRIVQTEDSIAILGLGRAGRRHKREYEAYTVSNRKNVDTLYELPWVPRQDGVSSEEFISPEGSTHLYVTRESADYDNPDYSFIEVAADDEALYLTSDGDFSVYMPFKEQLAA